MENIIITTSKDVNDKLIQGILTKVQQIYGTLNFSASLNGEINKISSLDGKIFSKIPSIEGVIVIQDTLIGQLKTIFDIEGSIEVSREQKPKDYDFYLGVTEITPSFIEQKLNTKEKILKNNIKVHQIKTYEVSNNFGTTFII